MRRARLRSLYCSSQSAMKRDTDIVVAALLFTIAGTAPALHAEMYKWINEDDSTTYSNQPPADASSVRELTTVETPPPARIEVQPPEPQKSAAEAPAPKRESDAASRAAAVRPLLPQAVRDPCLTSSDRFCHQKHSANYRPYVGYTPVEANVSESQAVVPPARGASSAASGSGSVSGGSRAKRD